MGEAAHRQVAHPTAETAADPRRGLRRGAQEERARQHRRATGRALAEEHVGHRGQEIRAEQHPGAEGHGDQRQQQPHRQPCADGEVEAEEGRDLLHCCASGFGFTSAGQASSMLVIAFTFRERRAISVSPQQLWMAS